jgi:RNA ligase (TIGR02306 family)
MRKLATVRTISDIRPIEGADKICLAIIDGWQVVVNVGEFKVGDLCAFFEIDSFLPIRPEFERLRKNCLRTFQGEQGYRIKTIRLRGQLSQGFALPIGLFIDDFIDSDEDEGQELCEFFFPGSDLTDLLKVKKYEKPVPAELEGQVTGTLPNFIPKTTQERCQNLNKYIFDFKKNARYEVSLKMDGSSFTSFYFNGEEGVCTRRWQVEINEKTQQNKFVRTYIDSNLREALIKYGKNIAVQGELVGPGIEQNRERFDSHKLFVFDIYDMDNHRYFTPEQRYEIFEEIMSLGIDRNIISHIPILFKNVSMDDLGIENINQLLFFADGQGYNPGVIREGVIFKDWTDQFSFKVISNSMLLSEEE